MICEYCNKEYEIDQEHRDKTYCCRNHRNYHWVANNKEKFKQSNIKSVSRHRDRINKTYNNWAHKNKDRIKEQAKRKMRKWQLKNAKKISEQMFVYSHRVVFEDLLGTKCKLCDSNKIMFHHKTYEDLPRIDYYEYSKYLSPLCGQHHKDVHHNKISLLY